MIPTYQDADMMVKLYEQYESERLRKARAWFIAVLGQKEEIAPEVFWEKYPRTGEEFSQFTTLYGFFEMVGVLLISCLICGISMGFTVGCIRSSPRGERRGTSIS
ncbi:hypothetical protein SAMN05518846_12074 [Brevibacillus centrosporus]|uniref:Uncharacterized protein n=1 Tax=Brevibacillus centrosporus TaxID=54910 RepID=A0A1I4CIX1_9BACL|nr:hypothetical protein SAMN05518846_12074 [Brevibacillus centrosporus]